MVLVLLALLAQEPDPRSLALLDAVERLHRELGDPADVRAAAAKLGNDRARILESVKALGWEPYAGVLRDAGGTLAAGSGNSLDRALLLRALLEAGGEKARLMRGAIEPAEGAALMAAFRPRAAAAPPAPDLGLDPAILAGAAEERKRERAARVEEVVEVALPEAARLGGILGAREPKPLEAPTEHWWVQVEEKGAWIDLDPSPVALKPRAGAPAGPKELAPLRRAVVFRVVLDRKAGGRADPQKLLEQAFDGAALQGRGVDLTLGPDAKEAPSGEKLAAMDPKAKLAALKAVKIWRAGLVVDGRQYGARPFDLQGNVYDVDAGGQAGAAAGLGRATGGLFGGAFGGGEAAPAFAFERLSLELEIREPGAAPRLQRRVLVAAGEAWLPVAKLSFRFDGAPPAPGETSRRALAALARNAPAFRKALKGEAAGARLDSRGEPPATLNRFASLRRAICDRIAGGAAWTQDRLGVSAETSRLFEADGAGRIRRSIDLFENPARFAGPDGAAKSLAAGVADTALEALLIARSVPGEAAPTAWARLERARLEGAKEELSERDGRVVLGSGRAWWELDPGTGAFVGRVAGGGGQGALEYAWETGGQICQASDLVGLWGLVPDGPEAANDAASYYGTFCSLFSGTTVRDKVMDKIQQMNKDLWKGTLDALSGAAE